MQRRDALPRRLRPLPGRAHRDLVASLNTPPKLVERGLKELIVEDERSFRHVGLYRDLKDVLGDYRFRVLPEELRGRWDRALLLNLTFWGANEGGDVLVSEEIPADVVAHVAWHHLAANALAPNGGAMSADALFLGESIASAFDLYLVGRLLGFSPNSTFLASQVEAIADSAAGAGMSDTDFNAMLEGVAADPERAFEDLRELLFDATSALVAAKSATDALVVLSTFDAHRFGALLHHYELSNWVLYARAYASTLAPDPVVRAIDTSLRAAPVALDWLSAKWLAEKK